MGRLFHGGRLLCLSMAVEKWRAVVLVVVVGGRRKQRK
ncbi:hypothetical protein BVRB_5g105970 [Beta vulgaris subsp. vulgaris]|nr:hypothetical protein BVRB_5g105970 [Beta vulgaris subsp. vulgaris]